VRRIEVDFDQDLRDDKVTKNTPADFQASFGFMLKRSNEWYGQELFCKAAADQGEFGAPHSDDRVFKLRRADRRLCNMADAN